MSIVTDAVRNATEAIQEQVEYELRAAWRIGYDYVHIYDPTPESGFDPSESFAIRQFVIPTNRHTPPRPDNAVYRCTYDLTEVSDEEIRRAIRGDL